MADIAQLEMNDAIRVQMDRLIEPDDPRRFETVPFGDGYVVLDTYWIPAKCYSQCGATRWPMGKLAREQCVPFSEAEAEMLVGRLKKGAFSLVPRWDGWGTSQLGSWDGP